MVNWFTDFKILRQRGKSLGNDLDKGQGMGYHSSTTPWRIGRGSLSCWINVSGMLPEQASYLEQHFYATCSGALG
jgi:hypothetical protein